MTPDIANKLEWHDQFDCKKIAEPLCVSRVLFKPGDQYMERRMAELVRDRKHLSASVLPSAGKHLILVPVEPELSVMDQSVTFIVLYA